MATTSLDKDKIRVLLLEGIHDTAEAVFREAGYTQIERRSGAVQGDELAEALDGVHFLGIRSRTHVTPEVLAQADRLVGIGAFCIGTDQIALDAAARQGIAVFNAPYSNTRSVAELVLAEAILLLRGVPEKNALAHRGVWAKSASGANEARGKTLGVVGYGNIGAQLSVLAEALGMRVLFYDVAARLPLGNARGAGAWRASGGGRRRHAPRARHAADARDDRRDGTGADARGRGPAQRLARERGGPRRAGRRRCGPATSAAPP